MRVNKQQLMEIVADALSVDRSQVDETSTFDEFCGMDSVRRLSMISALESTLGPDAVFDELRTVDDVPSLLAVMQAHGVLEI